MNDDTRWLNDAEMEMWLNLIRVVSRLPNALDEQVRRDAHLSYFEYSVLVVLEHAEDSTMRMSDLAYLCNGSLSRLSHVARRLEGDGLIERFPCSTDGRSILAKLTDHGRHRLAKAAPGHVERVRELIFDELTDEEVALLAPIFKRLLNRVTA